VHRATDEAGREDIELLPERLDQIDAWIAEGLLDGEELNAADFQVAVNVSAMLLSEDLKPYIEGRPAAALARRVAPDYVGHLGPIIPDEWMAPLRASAGDQPPASVPANSAPATSANGFPAGTDDVLRAVGLDDAKIASLMQPGHN
jgi:hypothetical protein